MNAASTPIAVTSAITSPSINHRHILAIINTERPGPRILDVGCGAGQLCPYLSVELPRLSGLAVDVSGIDVDGVGFDKETGFFPASARLIKPTDHWPFQDGSIDCVISNQVLEHVKDIDFFFGQAARVIRDGGISVHVFPLKSVFWEAHINQPFAHWILNHDLAVAYSKLWSRLGVGDRKRRGMTHEEFALDSADATFNYCFYRSYHDSLLAAQRAGLRASMRYTVDYYVAKLRSIAGLEPRVIYKRRPIETIPARMLSLISGVTLFLEKTNIHR
jgi:SAM-dependent methyltransferase